MIERSGMAERGLWRSQEVNLVLVAVARGFEVGPMAEC